MLRGYPSCDIELDCRPALPRPRRRGGVRRKLLIFLALLVGVVALLPMIIAKTPLLNIVVTQVTPSDVIRISIGGASLSWIRGPSLTAVQVNDSGGTPLLTADAITLDRAPINLAMNPRDLGVLQIIRPTIRMKVRPDGSNLEDALAKLLADIAAKSQPPQALNNTPGTPLLLAVQIVEGTVFAEDVATGRVWQISNVNAQYDNHGAGGGLGSGSLAGQLFVAGPNGTAPQPAGRLAVAFKPAAGNRQELTMQTEGVALAFAEPWLRRFAPGSQVSGTLSGNGAAAWTTNPNAAATDLSTAGSFTIDRLDATAPQLNGDRIRLARAELPWRIVSQPTGIAIEDLQFKTDVAQLAVRGRLDPATLSTGTPQAASFPFNGHNDVEVRGAIDLARLATMLPHALAIRGDTTITSGTVEIASRITPTAAGGQSLTGSVRTAQLAATSRGKPFSWDQPVSANFAVRRENGMLTLETLRCDSKFLRVDASGTFQQLKATANFDLTALSEQLGQFIDLSQLQLAGTGAAQLTWQQTESDKFSALATSDLTLLRVALRDGAVWTEPQLTVRAEAAGLLDPISHSPTRVDTAQLQVNGQGDQLDARLVGAVGLNAEPVWPVAIRSTGSIARWLTRARPWFAPGDWKIDGASDVTANLRVTKQSIDVIDSRIIVNNLLAASTGWNISEPRVEFSGDAHYSLASGELAANSAQLVTSTVSLATQGVRYTPGERGISQLAGAAAFRADAGRLAAWRAPTGQPAPYKAAGEFTGNIRFAQQAGRITGEVTATGQNLSLASLSTPASGSAAAPASSPAYQTTWQEPRLTIHGNTSYDAATDRLTFDQFQIQSNTLQANAAGQIERLSTSADCNLTGALNYDLAQVSPLLRPYVGEGVQLNGREQARFALAGKLNDEIGPQAQLTSVAINDPYQSAIRNPKSEVHWSRRIRAQLELPWSGANVYGLPVGPGKVAATLGDGSLQIAPLALAVGEGQLNLAPNIRFDPAPSELMMPAGPVITNVRISPQVSEAMLKYVAPVLAGATQSEGQFSLQLDGLRMPLADTKKTDSAGKLTVHSVRVTPGPTTQPFFSLAQQIEAIVKRRDPSASRQPASLLSIRDQQVNFRVVDGRVHHQNIEFQVGDVVMRSQGSVGVDETIAFTVSIPVQDQWIAKEPLLASLKGQSLQVPVTGTLKRPQVDQRAVANLSAQLVQNAAGQAVGNELNKALDKILKPRQ